MSDKLTKKYVLVGVGMALIVLICQGCDKTTGSDGSECDKTRLLQAVSTGQLAKIKQCNAPDRLLIQHANGMNTVALAEKEGYSELADYIRAKHYSYWKTLPQPYTEDLFFEAIAFDNVKITNAILKNGREYHLDTAYMVPAIVQAIFADAKKVTKFLLEVGSDPNLQFDLRPLLCISAMFNQYEITRELLLAKANPNAIDGAGKTALMFAAEEGNAEIVELLLSHGADPSMKEKENKTAAMWARENGHKALAEQLEKQIEMP